MKTLVSKIGIAIDPVSGMYSPLQPSSTGILVEGKVFAETQQNGAESVLEVTGRLEIVFVSFTQRDSVVLLHNYDQATKQMVLVTDYPSRLDHLGKLRSPELQKTLGEILQRMDRVAEMAVRDHRSRRQEPEEKKVVPSLQDAEWFL